MQDVGIPDEEQAAPRQQQAALVERVPQQEAEIAPAPAAPQQVIYQTFQQSAPQQVAAPAPQVVYNQQYYPRPMVVLPRVVYPPYPVYPPPGYMYRYGYGPGY